MSFLMGSRHILMGAALASYLEHLSIRQALPALFFICDESWAMALADASQLLTHRISLQYYLGASGGLYLNWIIA